MSDESKRDWNQLFRRLEAVERRLDRLEKAPVTSELPAPPHQPQTISASRPEEPDDFPTVLAVEEPLPEVPEKPALRLELPASPAAAANLEQTIGLKWAGWIGAIVLVVGVGLGIKFAYEQGWFGHLPVEVRLLFMSLGGFALLAAGEVVYRRINSLSAVGPFGAGVAVLFLVSYAGNFYYNAYTHQTAFLFGILTTLVGSGVAIRARLVAIAVLAQVGGLLGPLILSTGQRPGLALLAYLFMLQMVALILALWGRSPKWWILRGISFAGTGLWVMVCLAEGQWGLGLANEVLWFTVLYAAAYQGELFRSAFWVGGDEGPAADVAKGAGAVFSMLVTAGLTGVVLHIFYDFDSPTMRGSAVLVLAGLCAAGGWLLPAGENRLVRTLQFGYQIQALALVILFVPVTLTDVWISLAWGILSLAMAAVGARFAYGPGRGAALVAWVLALGRLLIDLGQRSGPAWQTWLAPFDHPIHGYTVLAWLLALAGLGIAMLLQANLANADPAKARDWRHVAWLATMWAGLVWATASLDGLPRLGGTFFLVLWAWLLIGFDFLPPRLNSGPQPWVVIFIAALKWIFVDTWASRLSGHWSALEYFPVFNPSLGMGLLLALSLMGMTWLHGNDRLGPPPGPKEKPIPFHIMVLAVGGLAVFFVGWGFSFEVDRIVERASELGHVWLWPALQMKLFGWTLLWLALGLGLAAGQQRAGYSALVPWIFLLLVAGKFLLLDMLFARLAQPSQVVPAYGVFNYQVFIAALVLAGLFYLPRLAPLAGPSQETARATALLTHILALLILLCAGTLEIDRAFAFDWAKGLGDRDLALQVSISIFWSLFAAAAIGCGFRFRSESLRYFGLTLFGVTLLKVVGADMSQVRFGYRILSLMGLGLLLLATSVLYGKLSPRLLHEPKEPRP